jgi:hypothetical protein
MLTATHPPDSEVVSLQKITLRCFVYRDNHGLYIAECIDLNLMVKDRKEVRAMRELRDAVLGYVRVAAETGEVESLIPRPSPLSHRVHYQLVRLAARLSLLHPSRLFQVQPTSRCFA